MALVRHLTVYYRTTGVSPKPEFILLSVHNNFFSTSESDITTVRYFEYCVQKPYCRTGIRLPGSVPLSHIPPSRDTTMRQLCRSKPASVGLCVV